MRAGIDYRALKAELATVDADERRRRMREVAAWIRASDEGRGIHSAIGLGLVGLGAAMLVLGVATGGGRTLAVAGLLALAIGNLIGLAMNRRAVRWRQAHPFAQWRGSSDRGESGPG